MVRLLPRTLSRIAVACSLALPLTSVIPAWAQDAAAPTPAAEPAAPAAPAAPPAAPATPAAPAAPVPAAAAPAAEPSADLKRAVANYWHYGKIARYDLQAAEGEKILANASDPAAVMAAFNSHIDSTEVNGRKDNVDEWLLKWQGIEKVSDQTNKIIAVLNQGRATKRKDPAFIDQQIQRLSGGQRGYELAVQQLRQSGEYAVPQMLEYLRNPTKRDMHGGIRRALRDLGRSALNPLVAATEMSGAESQEPLIAVVAALGDIGYDEVVPYLARLANDQGTPGAVRAAAQQALSRAGASDAAKINASNEFYGLAEKFYYDNSSITSDVRDAQAPANVWFWSNDKGLTYKEIPQQIFNEVMAMRAAEYALKLGSSQDALSLWLASNYKREAELPQGATDPTRAENQPPAHYYAVSSGTQYLNAALSRALRDRNSAVALRAIKSLQEIVGKHNLFAEGQAGALIDAMSSPDRLVRFESAFGLAAALPTQQFQGQDRVVPLLAEALAQTGTPSVLVVAPNQDQLNTLVEGLRSGGFAAAGATSADTAVSSSSALPAVDVVIVSEELGADVDRLFATASQNPRLQGASRIVVTKTAGSPYVARAVSDRMLSVTQATDAAALKPVIDAARAKGSSLPLDGEAANSYASRAGQLLSNLAISNGQVLDLSAAEQTLLAALNDPRPDIVKSAGNVLGRMDTKPAQPGLLIAASGEKAADDVKISLYKSLAHNAATFGRQLEGQQVETLEKTVVDAQNLDVRAAAAEARGALNLPAEQAKSLIINQSTGTGGAPKPAAGPAAAAAR